MPPEPAVAVSNGVLTLTRCVVVPTLVADSDTSAFAAVAVMLV